MSTAQDVAVAAKAYAKATYQRTIAEAANNAATATYQTAVAAQETAKQTLLTIIAAIDPTEVSKL